MQILKEFRDVISRAKFGFSQKQITEAFKQVISICNIILPKTKLHIIKEDPPNNKVLECAVEGKVEYIVSGDKHLLKLKKYKKIKIVKISDFLKLL